MRRFEYYEPATLEEASKLLPTLGAEAFLYAGGTDLLVEIRERLRRVRHVVDIKRIPGLSSASWDETRGLSFGALVTAGQLERLPLVADKYPNLHAALASLGSIQVRNRATVVGNVCRASPSADTIPPLIADEARVHIYSRSNALRVVPLAEFFTGPGRTVLVPGDIVTGITVPPPREASGRAYIKHGRRKAMELATVGVAASLELDGRTCTGIRIALGAVGATVLRAPKAEALLTGSDLGGEVIDAAARQAMEECTPISNVRASADYRREMVGVLTRRAVTLALENAA
jgi:CO/xanthine dehydrogenase FAD-binding subunit